MPPREEINFSAMACAVQAYTNRLALDERSDHITSQCSHSHSSPSQNSSTLSRDRSESKKRFFWVNKFPFLCLKPHSRENNKQRGKSFPRLPTCVGLININARFLMFSPFPAFRGSERGKYVDVQSKPAIAMKRIM